MGPPERENGTQRKEREENIWPILLCAVQKGFPAENSILYFLVLFWSKNIMLQSFCEVYQDYITVQKFVVCSKIFFLRLCLFEQKYSKN